MNNPIKLLIGVRIFSKNLINNNKKLLFIRGS